MAIHLAGLVAATGVIMLCTLLPFLPGRHDSLAVPLSGMAQLFGTAGLLLVPFGAAWWWAEYARASAGKRRVFGIAALVVAALVWMVISLVGAIHGGFSVGVAALIIGAWAMARLLPRLRRAASNPATTSAIPVYLVVLPLAAALLQYATVPAAVDSSRSRAIRNSERLIADIERYRAANGRYPASLLSLWPDYSPGLIGIERFHYEPSGEAYNVVFEQFTYRLGTREIVMYNPRDEQVATSHAMDLIDFAGADLERRRGFYAVHDARHPHWKYFWFD